MKERARLVVAFVLITFSVAALSTTFDTIMVGPIVGKISKIGGLGTVKILENDPSITIDYGREPIANDSMSEPLFTLKGVSLTSYLRVKIGQIYSSGSWSFQGEATDYRGEIIPIADPANYTRKSSMMLEIRPNIFLGGFIPVVKDAFQVNNSLLLKYYPEDQAFYTNIATDSTYNVGYNLYLYNKSVLENATVTSNSGYLDVPEELMAKIKDLATFVAREKSSPYEKAVAIESFLRSNFLYTKNYTAAPSGVDPVEWFLFNSKEGVCGHFNTAFVLMARSIGIPSRLCAGYLIAPYLALQNVTSEQNHAYAEVRFDGLGWIIFDATRDAPGSSESRIIPTVVGEGDRDRDMGVVSKPAPEIVVTFPSNGTHLSSSEVHIEGYVSGDEGEPSVNDTRFISMRARATSLIPDAFVFTNNTDIVGEVNAKISYGNRTVVVNFFVDLPSSSRVATFTEIISSDSTMVKGCNFLVEGIVTDDYGLDVSELNVQIFLSEDKFGISSQPTLIGWGAVKNGKFSIQCRAPSLMRVGGYWLIAKTTGDGDHMGSDSDPFIELVAETELRLTMPKKVIVHRGFYANFTLLEKASRQLLPNENINLDLSDEGYYYFITDQNGRASLFGRIEFPGNYTITAFYESWNGHLGSNVTQAFRVVEVKIDQVTNVIIRGEENVIVGRAHAEELPLDHEPIVLTVDLLSASGKTDANGLFSLKLKTPTTLPLGAYRAVYEVGEFIGFMNSEPPYRSESDMRVMAKTRLTTWANNSKIYARLMDDLGQPISDVNLVFLSKVFNSTVTTDDSGEAEIPQLQYGYINWTVNFKGNNLYVRSLASGSIGVAQPTMIIFTPENLFLAITATALPGVFIFLLLKYPGVLHPLTRRNRQVNKSPARKTSSPEGPFNIVFPKIDARLPLVWGEDLPLTVVICKNGRSSSASLAIDGVPTEELSLVNGPAELSMALTKGTHIVTVLSREGHSEAEVKIVDYREEIVNLFGELIEKLVADNWNVRDEMTPREMQSSIMEKVPLSQEEALENLMSLFETASYSTHDITRDHYETFYLSIKGVMG